QANARDVHARRAALAPARLDPRARHLAPRKLAINGRLLRETEHALTDDVAGHLGRAAADRRATSAQEALLVVDGVVIDERDVADAIGTAHLVAGDQHPAGTEQVHDEREHALLVFVGHESAERSFWTGRAGGANCFGALGREPDDFAL